MYYPIFRGKLNELLALRELAILDIEKRFCPVIEPGICQHSCHPYLNQATKTSLALTRLDRRTGLRAVG